MIDLDYNFKTCMDPINKSNYSEEQLTEWFEKTFNLNKVGNPVMQKNRFVQAVTEDNISPELIFKKYKAHIAYCKPHQSTGGFTKAEFKILDLYDFVNYKKYENEYTPIGNNNEERDRYFYGDLVK
jgi:hypothetical protein